MEENKVEKWNNYLNENKDIISRSTEFKIISKKDYNKRTILYVISSVLITLIFITLFYYLAINDKFKSTLFCPQNISSICEAVTCGSYNFTLPNIPDCSVTCPEFPEINVYCNNSL